MRRYEYAPLEKWSVSELEQRTGIARRTFQRWREPGIPERSVEKIAHALGFMAHELWPEFLDVPEPRSRRYYRENAEYVKSQARLRRQRKAS